MEGDVKRHFSPSAREDADVLGHPAPAHTIAESLGCGSALGPFRGGTIQCGNGAQ